MYKINLNSDLGEGALCDGEIIPLITSANIACGFHAGDCSLMRETLRLCKNNNVNAGAHPGYPDRENFGRTNMDVTARQVYEYTVYQLGALSAMAKAEGVKLEHIKPHGAMYNMAAKSKELSAAIAQAVKDFDDSLILLGLSGSEMIEQAKALGLKSACEVFADRANEEDGTWGKRGLEGAMIEDENEAIERVLKMITTGKTTAYSGEEIEIEAHSVCVHGDGAKALNFVKALKKAFADNDIETLSLSEVIK